MPFEIVRNDITKMRVDAIVNAANRSLLGGGGVDGAIHRAAGPGLLAECLMLGGCRTGQAKITRGHRLPAKYVIHTVGPVWHGGARGERELLAACYKNALKLALERGCETVAFPLISAGAYGYPKDQAMAVAVEAIRQVLLEHDIMVYLVVFGRTEFLTGKKLFRDVQQYIDDVYVAEHVIPNVESARRRLWREDEDAALRYDRELAAPRGDSLRGEPSEEGFFGEALPDAAPRAKRKSLFPLRGAPKGSSKSVPSEAAPSAAAPRGDAGREDDLFEGAASFRAATQEDAVFEDAAPMAAPPDWDRLMEQLDEGFSEALLRFIDEKGMTDAQCYKRANVDRKLFSKIRSNPGYRPSKPTVFAFAVALELDLAQTQGLLGKAGFALSHSSKFDIILEYFIKTRNYNVYEINEVLFHYDMPLLGSGMNA